MHARSDIMSCSCMCVHAVRTHICAQVCCIHGLTDSKHSFFIERYAARTPLSALFNASLKSHLATIFIRLECQMCVSSQVHLSSRFLYSSAKSRGRLRALRDGGFFLLDPSAPAVWLAIYKEQQQPFIYWNITEHCCYCAIQSMCLKGSHHWKANC